MTKISVDSLAQEYEYYRGLGDMSETVRIATRSQFKLNIDNRQYSIISLHGVQSVWIFESTVGKTVDIPTLR